MKLITFILPLIISLSFGQVYESQLPKKQFTSRILSDTSNLPFFDDFSTTPSSTPSSSIWSNNGATVTQDYAINSPTFNALTLDGLDESGKPYVFVSGTGENISVDIDGEADEIESKAIDLSLLTTNDNVAISFFWQKGGVSQNTLPDLKDGDSLRLFFLKNNGQWEKVWPKDTATIQKMDTLSSGQPFNFEFVELLDSSFFHSGFKFKFTTYGKLSGSWDVWHLDHIYLDKDRFDDNVQDFAFSSLNVPLFGEYHSIPTEALVNNNFTLNEQATVKVFNLSNKLNFFGFSSLTISHPDSRTILSTDTQTGNLIQPREDTDVSFNIDNQTFTSNIVKIALNDSINLLTKVTLETPVDSIPSNDTLEQITTISNYYAYDDGTSEMGIGFGEYGEFVMEFSIDRIDTLTAIDFGFLKIGHDLTNTPISIRVWESINGANRSVSSELLTSLFTGVKYDTSGLTRYNLSEAVVIRPGKYYVGYESSSLNPIYLGFDKNTDHVSSKGYLRRGEDDWSQEEITNVTGTPIIHPIFGKAFSLRIANEKQEEKIKTSLDVELYPNPAQNILTVNGEISSYKIYNSSGIEIITDTVSIENNMNEIDVTSLVNGIYYFFTTDGRLEESKTFSISK